MIPTDRSQPFGNAPRNVARGPAVYPLDLGLHKGIRPRLRPAELEFRIEAFNVLNRTQLRRAERQPVVHRLRHHRTLSTTPRQIQLGVKMYF